jgi:hypothetical protein
MLVSQIIADEKIHLLFFYFSLSYTTFIHAFKAKSKYFTNKFEEISKTFDFYVFNN